MEWLRVDTGENRDLLVIEGKCFGIRLRIILVYFDSDKKKNSQEGRVLTGEYKNRKGFRYVVRPHKIGMSKE